MAKNEPKIYRHSNIKSIIWRIIAIVIAAAIVLALTAFFGFRKFIAYTETGKLYLDIPWLYGYMSGPPTEDELAPYLEPVKPPANVAIKVSDEVEYDTDDGTSTDDGDVQTDENGTSPENGVPQYVDPEADSETGEE